MKKDNKRTSITISIPAYNDAKSVNKLVTDIETVATNNGLSLQILLINDGSQDDTHEVIVELSKRFPNIRILDHKYNLGFGKTLKQVFTLPQTEWVLFLPGDNQFPASNILSLIKYCDSFDFILGYRKHRQDPWFRTFYSICYNKIISLVAGYKVMDVNSIVLYRSEVLKRFVLNSDSAFVHAEFFLKTYKLGYRIKQIEVEHKKREFGFGSGGKLTVIAHTIKDLIFYLTKRH